MNKWTTSLKQGYHVYYITTTKVKSHLLKTFWVQKPKLVHKKYVVFNDCTSTCTGTCMHSQPHYYFCTHTLGSSHPSSIHCFPGILPYTYISTVPQWYLMSPRYGPTFPRCWAQGGYFGISGKRLGVAVKNNPWIINGVVYTALE